MIPYGRQQITEEDLQAVVATLRSDFLTQGPQVPAFERELCELTGASYAVAMCNATAALHGACDALGVSEGDTVWTTPISFVASANCALYCGASVDFVDIDPTTYNMCSTALRAKLEVARAAGRLPKVVIPVALCGRPCDMRPIRALAEEFGFRTILDASHAIGAIDGGVRVGSGSLADITVFSFHPVKIVTTGEGGAALTDDPALARRLQLFRSHYVTRQPDEMVGASEGPWYYQQVGLGYNYRMTDLQAALGVSQLGRLEEFLSARHRLAARYDELLADVPVDTPTPLAEGSRSALHLYVVLVREGALRRREVFTTMRSMGVGVNVHYIPIHTQPYYRDLGFAAGDFPSAESYYASAITLPLHPSLTDGEQDLVVRSLTEALRA